MTNPGSSPEPSKNGFRVTLAQGMIGAVTLAGTTAIPLLVQKYIGGMPAPASSPAAIVSPQATPTPTDSAAPVAPAPTPSVTTSPDIQLTPAEASTTQSDDEHPGKGKGKKKGKQDD